MEINWILLGIIAVFVIILILFIIRVNQKDKKTLLYFKGWDEQVQEELCEEVETENQLDILTENDKNICLN